MKKARSNKDDIVGSTIRGALASCLFVGAAILGLLSTNHAQVQTCTPPPGGMVSWWPGDGNANDIQGSNNGTLQNGATFAPGIVGQAFTFDGIDDYVQATDTGLPFGTAARTLDLWMQPGFDARVPVIYGSFAPSDAFYVLVNGANACIGQWGGGPPGEPCGSTDVTDGSWHHVAMTYDGSGTVLLYVDGALEASVTKTYTTTQTGKLYMGSTVEGSQEYYTGLVDEVEIFNRALSQSEIQAIYGAGSAGKCRTCTPPPANMLSWWPGDGNTQDITGHRDAVLRDNATFGAGYVQQAFVLDGNGDFIEVPDDPALNFGTGDFTIDIWANFNTTDGEQVVMEKWVQGFSKPSTGWTLSKLDGNSLLLAMADGSGPEVAVVSDPLSIPTGTWIHFAAKRAAGVVTLFMNGTQIAQGTSLLSLNSASSLKFGHRGSITDTPGSEDDRGFYLNGRVDEVEVFNRACRNRKSLPSSMPAAQASASRPIARRFSNRLMLTGQVSLRLSAVSFQ